MKKQILSLSAFLLIGSALFMTGCSEDDTTAPVITILGDNPTVSLLNVTYTDAGATATDDKDGNLTSSIVTTNEVNKTTAGAYQVNYSVSDEAGNAALESRDVYVVDLSGSYSVVDVIDGTPPVTTPYTDVLTVTGGTNINFAKFAGYTNGSVNGSINGSDVTVLSQSVLCGSPAANRTFSGSGTLSFTLSGNNIVRKIVLGYTEVTNGTTAEGTGTYTK